MEVERDLSVQQQFLDVVVVRRGRGRFAGRLPDGLEGLVAHNLVTFKSHHEALDSWAVKELVGHYVAYRKLVSQTPSELLSEEQFRLYAVCARLPQKLSQQVPWQERQAGVYDCRWGTDTVRVVVAGELPREAHNAPLHLFSALGGAGGLRRRGLPAAVGGDEPAAGSVVRAASWGGDGHVHNEGLRDRLHEEALAQVNAATAERNLTIAADGGASGRPAAGGLAGLPEERLAGLSAEARLACRRRLLARLSAEQIRQYLEQTTAGQEAPSRKRRRKK